MNLQQEINENPVLKKVDTLFEIVSLKVNTDIDVTDEKALQLYFAYARENTLKTLVTLALIQAKLNSGDDVGINRRVAETLGNVLKSQTEKGLEKYPNTVNPSDYDTNGWLTHAIEELVDTTVYETCLIELLNG